MSWVELLLRVFGWVAVIFAWLVFKEIWDWWKEKRGKIEVRGALRGRGRPRHTRFGAAKAVRKDLVVPSQGLRGSDQGVVWRREMSLPHWKPGQR
jgi:hypothetical protein